MKNRIQLSTIRRFVDLLFIVARGKFLKIQIQIKKVPLLWEMNSEMLPTISSQFYNGHYPICNILEYIT